MTMNNDNTNIRIDDIDVKHLLASGTVDEITKGINQLIEIKNRIERDLVSHKVNVIEHKNELMRKGMNPRAASVKAEEDEADWRDRAVGAIKVIDSRLVHLKTRRHELIVKATKKGKKVWQSFVFEANAATLLAQEIQDCLDQGWHIVAMTTVGSAIIAVGVKEE